MRVVVAHNFYRSATPSGENSVVAAEVQLLQESGVEVRTLFRASDDIERLPAARKLNVPFGSILNRDAIREARLLLADFRPDVLHIHNVYPLLSPAILDVAKEMSVATVHTVHNFRPECVKGTMFRDGAICEECMGRPLAPNGLKHACYRSSRLQTASMIAGRRWHAKTWRGLDRYIVLTDFHQKRLVSQGISANRIAIRPTWAPDPGPVGEPGSGYLFLGRLEEEKGLRLLLDGWKMLGPDHRLRIAGAGSLASEVRQACESSSNCEFLGPVDGSVASGLLRASAAVVVPSIWFEGFPRVIAEAFSYGRAVAATKVGALNAIITEEVGWKFPPSPAALAEMVSSISNEQLATRGRAARNEFERSLTSERAAASLLAVYRAAIDQH